MRISSDGWVTWTPAGIYQTHCESTVTYYPMDTQTCEITVSSWGYTSYEINLILPATDSDWVTLTNFKENGEWLLGETTAITETSARGGQSVSRLTFLLTLERRPFFHIINTLFPIILFSFLICGVFKLPADSGEKVGYALTVLLAYAVYLIIVTGTIPQTSTSTSILGTYTPIILI